MRVMLVDDDARMRLVLAKMLESAGMRVTYALGDGEEALARLGELAEDPAMEGVDLLITDCRMPRMDGIQLVTALRARGDLTPVIMLSGEHDPHLVVRAIKRCRAAGMNGHVPKPLNPQVFFEKIWQAMSAGKSVAV